MMLNIKGPQSLTSGYALDPYSSGFFRSYQLLIHMSSHLGNITDFLG